MVGINVVRDTTIPFNINKKYINMKEIKVGYIRPDSKGLFRTT